MPGTRYPALYDVAVDDHAENDRTGGTTVINPFQVPAGDDELFLSQWHQVREHVREQPGRLGMRLYRSRDGRATFRFVLIARWADGEHALRSHQPPAVRAAVAAMQHQGHPALYKVIAN